MQHKTHEHRSPLDKRRWLFVRWSVCFHTPGRAERWTCPTMYQGKGEGRGKWGEIEKINYCIIKTMDTIILTERWSILFPVHESFTIHTKWSKWAIESFYVSGLFGTERRGWLAGAVIATEGWMKKNKLYGKVTVLPTLIEWHVIPGKSSEHLPTPLETE